MSKVFISGNDLNKLLERFVGKDCSFKGGELDYKTKDLSIHAKNIDLKAMVDIDTSGLKISAKELKFNHEGADVDFSLG